jgi:Mlc titration factor MtfA (ptsG expression regulator)
MFGARRRGRRHQRGAELPHDWRDVLAETVEPWPALSEAERARVESFGWHLSTSWRWEAARGFEVTDEMVATICGQAALMAAGLPDDVFRHVGSVLVHPTTMVLHGEHSTVEGIVSDDATPIEGEAHWRGPMLLAWDAVIDDLDHPGDGRNVVHHELAHQIDMLDGTVDGTPPLETQQELERWIEVCTPVYEAVVVGEGGEVLDPYAGVNPGEFFAVASEAFFDVPAELAAEHPDLYDVFAGFYRQDPRRWYA